MKRALAIIFGLTTAWFSTPAFANCVDDSHGNTVCNGVVMDSGVTYWPNNSNYCTNVNTSQTGTEVSQDVCMSNSSPQISFFNRNWDGGAHGYNIYENIYGVLEINGINSDGSNPQTECQFSFDQLNPGAPDGLQCVGRIQGGNLSFTGGTDGTCTFGGGGSFEGGNPPAISGCGLQVPTISAHPNFSGVMLWPNSGQTAMGRLMALDGQDLRTELSENLYWDTTAGQWKADSTSAPGWSIDILAQSGSDSVSFLHTTSGSNPKSPSNFFSLDSSGNVTVPAIKSSTGKRYVCVDTNGKLVSQAAACSGT